MTTTYSASYAIPQNMRDTINNCTIGLGVVGIPAGMIGPGTDLAVIAPAWGVMTATLAGQAGHTMNEDTAVKLAVAVATGAGAFVAGSKVASSLLGWLLAIPTVGLSLVAAGAANAALNASFTKVYGESVARYFLQTKTDSTEAAVKVLIGLVAVGLGLPSPSPYVVA